MKFHALAVVVLAMLVIRPFATAQGCYTPITSWTVDLSYSGSGGGSCMSGSGTCTVNESASASNLNLSLFSLSCSTVAWCVNPSGGSCGISSTNVTAQVNDTWVTPCPAGETSQYSGVDSGAFIEWGLEIQIPGTYLFGGIAAGNGTATNTDCFGDTTQYTQLVDAGTDTVPSFSLPSNIDPLSETSYDFTAPDWLQASTNWSLSFTATPNYNTDTDCKEDGNSSIGCSNQSLGEDVPVVGTGFRLHYQSDRTSGAGGNSIATSVASMLGGWTLSVYHAYDPATNTLFLGDGGQRNGSQLGTPLSYNGNLLVTSEDGSEVYVFTTAGQHLQTVRPLTGALEYQFAYDTAGKLITVTDANGNVTTIHRNTSEVATSIVSPYGQSTTLTMDGNGFLSQVTGPLGKSTVLVNTANGLLTSRTDANGNTFTYTYDGTGRLINDADPLGGYTAATRNNATSGLGWTVGQTTAMGRTSSYQTTVTAPWVMTPTSTFSKQQLNTWPDGLQVSASTNLQNGQLSESFALPDGMKDSTMLGPDTVWGLQRPVATSEALTQGTLTMNMTGSRTIILSTAGNPFSVATQGDIGMVNGRTFASNYSALTHTRVNTSPVGRTLTLGLDSLERVSSTQIQGLTATVFAYDSHGRLLSTTQGTRKTMFGYNSHGFLASIIDPLALKTSFAYDADGHLTATTLPDGRVIRYTYDPNGNLTSVAPPGKSAHSFTYNAVNLLDAYTPPAVSGTGSTTYAYDLDRELTTITRPDGLQTNYGYDTAGRLIYISTPTGGTNFTYNSTTGDLAIAVRGTEKIAYGYNGPLRTKSTWTGTIAGSVGRSYNNNFWVTGQTINGANGVAFQHDNDGLLTKAGSLAIKRSSKNGLITGTTLGAATDTRSYNGFGELIGYTASIEGVTAYSVQFTRDADGRISGKTEVIGAATNTYAYSYDLAGRLTAAAKNTTTDTYSYDSNSNRMSATTPSGTASGTYDAQDRLLTYGNTFFTYTANGELTSQAIGTQKTTYKYDVLGNLISVNLPNATKITYLVDAENHRVGKEVNGVLQIGFLYDGDMVVAQLNGSDQLVTQFVYATGSTSPDYMVTGGVTYRIFSDHLGSPVLVVNTATGAVAEQISYDEFGNVIADTNPGFQPFGFAGGLYDQDTKLVRFGSRDYNSALGRWTVKDPIRFAGKDANFYGYVVDDPVNLLDPSGLDWKYNQPTGQLTHSVDGGNPDGGATVVDTGYSGHGTGVNNSSMQSVPNTGPIPQGTYTIQTQQNNTTSSGTSLPASMRITMPDGGSTLLTLPDGGTRSGFLIHGDNSQANQSASHGCIILQKSTRDNIGNSGDHTLIVDP